MLFKLAMRNVRRSLRDYVIYFVTLVLGVAMFYAFNSIGSQSVLFDTKELASPDTFENVQEFMGMFSAVIACVLGFLVLYSNGFLIRRRKREFGTYEILGMSPGQVARVILYETMFVGVGALAVGLIVGILASQALSFLTGLLFGATIQNYQFVFSATACQSTVICFVVIFVLMALFNTVTVSRYKLISLLHADTKSQKAVVRNPFVCLIAFIIAIGILAFAYYELVESEMLMLDDPRFLAATVCMLVGSLLFFWSLAGFVAAVVTRTRGLYLRGIRPFTVRQVTSRINTAFLSLWAVCVLLFFSITVFSSGMGLVNVFVGDVEAANPYDATIRADVYWQDYKDRHKSPYTELGERKKEFQESDPEAFAIGEKYDWSIADYLSSTDPELWNKTIGDSVQLDMYEVLGQTYLQTIENLDSQAAQDALNNSLIGDALNTWLEVVPFSQFDALCALTGSKASSLASDEFLLVNNVQYTDSIARAFADSDVTLNLYGHELRCQPEVRDVQVEDSTMLASAMIIVVPDAVTDYMKAQGALPHYEYLDIMFVENGLSDLENSKNLERIIAQAQPMDYSSMNPENSAEYMQKEEQGEVFYVLKTWPVSMYVSGIAMMQQSGGLRMLITYLALYIGLVFLICTAAILAIQQLTGVVDSQGRYRMLWRLGVDERKLNHSLLAQVLIYFLAPLALAICHSVCALYVLNESLFTAFSGDIISSVGMCAGLVLAIYGGYMLITYFAARSMLKPAMRLR